VEAHLLASGHLLSVVSVGVSVDLLLGRTRYRLFAVHGGCWQ